MSNLFKKAIRFYSTLFLFSCCTVSTPDTNVEIVFNYRSSAVFVEVEDIVKIQGKKTSRDFTEVTARSGSGSIIKHSGDITFILTAAHVCTFVYKSQIERIFPFYNPKFHNTKILSILKFKDVNGEQYEGLPFIIDKDSDLCIAISRRIQLQSLKIAKNKPKYGERCYNISFPLGLWSKGFSPSFDGFYMGETHGSLKKGISAGYSIPTSPGASGSPILNRNGEVVGVTHSYLHRFNHISLSATLNQINKILDLMEKKLKDVDDEDLIVEIFSTHQFFNFENINLMLKNVNK